MDEEGRRLAAMSDAEWARHVAEIARRNQAAAQGGPPVRPRLSKMRIAYAVVATLVMAGSLTLLLVRHHDHRDSDASVPPAATHGPPFADTPAARWAVANVALHMPAAHGVGPYRKKVVAGALDRARQYLLAAHTDPRVLTGHHLAVLTALAAPDVAATQKSVYATELARGDTLAAPVHALGTVTVAYEAAHDHYAAHLVVSSNVLWAYALRADYPVDRESDGVVVLHDRIRLGFYLGADFDGPKARAVPQQDHSLEVDGDCGYGEDGLVGLPRVDDPGGEYTDHDVDRDKFDLGAPFAGSHGCR